jgi:hypothetical protein
MAYQEDANDFVCNCHDPHNRDGKAHRTSSHPGGGVLAVNSKNHDQGANRQAHHPGSEEKPTLMLHVL